jgi:hypothetical protein
MRSPLPTLLLLDGPDPFGIALPEEDESEMAWHKATLIAEEDIREQVTIPAEFAARHLWSPSSSPSDASSFALDVHLADHVTFPPILLAEARETLLKALAPSAQLSSVAARPAPEPSSATSKNDAAKAPSQPNSHPLPEPIVTLFCPFDHTAGIIDALVCNLALGQHADVLVLDALMFAQGGASSLGPG